MKQKTTSIRGLRHAVRRPMRAALGIAAGLAMATAGVPASALAQAPADSPGVQSADGIEYLNGGVDADSQAQMRQQAGEWPVRLTFSAQSNNAFVAGVDLTVADASGKRVMHLDNAGPITYLRLPAGRYRLTATHDGQSVSHDLKVGQQGSDLSFHWP